MGYGVLDRGLKGVIDRLTRNYTTLFLACQERITQRIAVFLSIDF
jgi:hypothetical protein